MLYFYIKSLLSSIRKNKFFYSANLIGFLTGFLVLIVILTFVYQELSFDRFHQKAETIYRINSGGYGVTPLCFGEKLNNKIPEIDEIVRFRSERTIITKNKQQLDDKTLYYTDNNIFKVFSFDLITGNTETVLKEPYSVVLSKTLSRQLFGKESPIGETVKNKTGLILTVTGVMKDIPLYSHLQCDMFVSIETLKYTDEDAFNCGEWSNLTYLLLKENSEVENVMEKVNLLLEDFCMTTSEGKFQLKLQSIKEIYFDYDSNKYDGSSHGNFQTVMIYLAISVLLLLLVVINYINLFIAISSSKIKPIAIKKILGATRKKIAKQFVFEAIGVSIISYTIAIVFVELFLTEISGLLGLNISGSLNWNLIYFLFFFGIVIIGIITGIISGYSVSKLNAIKVLNNKSFFKSKGIQRKLLLIIQLTIVAVLLNSTFIINKQLNYILDKDLGFNYENIAYLKLDEKLIENSDVLKRKLKENPSIKGISFSSGLIGDGTTKAPLGSDDNIHLSNIYSVDPDYIDLYKMEIKSGRNFSWHYKTDFENTCIINEKACKVFGLEEPLDEMLGENKIVGVISDFNYTSLHNSIEPLVIFCEENGRIIQLTISENEISSTLRYIENTCKMFSSEYNCNISFMDNRLKQLYKSEFELKKNFSFFSLVTLIIALLGIVGLALFMVKKKYKEISIRKLFGARLKDTFQIIAKEYFIIICISNLLAFPLTYFFMNRWITNFQYMAPFGYFAFIRTFLIVVAFTFLAITYMILKSHKISLIDTIKEE